MNSFKFLAECKKQATNLEEILPDSIFHIEYLEEYAPEVVVTLKTNLHIELVRQFMYSIEDSEVMRETLTKADEYTGERVPKPGLPISVN